MNKIKTEFRLKEDDILYFLHIPKTAGTTLISILDDFFDFDSICRKQSWDELLPKYPISFTHYRLFRGHFGYGLYRNLPRISYYITMLRDPIERIISDFDHYKRTPLSELPNLGPGSLVAKFFSKSNNLLDFINDPLYKLFLTNTQTRFIGLDLDVIKIANSYTKKTKNNFLFLPCKEFLSPEISDRKLIKNAKQHLKEFKFIGLVERFEESLFLLCYTFGWKPIRNIRKLNVASSRTNLHQLSVEAIEKIKKCVRLDTELYQYAQQIFDSRYSQMIKDLNEKYYETKFSKLPFKEQMYELLEKHYEECLHTAQVPRTKSLDYDFRQRIFGAGWHSREDYNNSGLFFRWTGPETTSTIDLALARDKDLKIKIRVLMYLTRDILESLKLQINNHPVDIRILHENDCKAIFEGIIPKSILHDTKPFTRLTLTVNRTISPASLNSSSNDKRMLGVAIDQIKIISL